MAHLKFSTIILAFFMLLPSIAAQAGEDKNSEKPTEHNEAPTTTGWRKFEDTIFGGEIDETKLNQPEDLSTKICGIIHNVFHEFETRLKSCDELKTEEDYFSTKFKNWLFGGKEKCISTTNSDCEKKMEEQRSWTDSLFGDKPKECSTIIGPDGENDDNKDKRAGGIAVLYEAIKDIIF